MIMRALRGADFESETRADMWFRRAGELLDEVSKLREQVASATAVAALVKAEAAGAGTTARSEIAAARSEAASLAAKCDLLQHQIDERTASVAIDDELRRRHVAEIEAERSEKRRMALELSYVQQARDIAEKEMGSERRARERTEGELAAEKQARQLADAERVRQEQRANTLRGQVADLEHLLELAQRETRRHVEQAASPMRASAALVAPTAIVPPAPAVPVVPPSQPSVSPPAPPEPPAPPAALVPVPASSAPMTMAVVPAAEPDDTASGRSATERALSLLVRGIVGGELGSLLDELRNAAVEKAEAACSSRVAVLEAAVGELLGSMDAETHRLLLKWRAQVESTRRENAVLREQQRLAHVHALDQKQLIHSLQMEQQRRQQPPQQSGQSHLWSPGGWDVGGQVRPTGTTEDVRTGKDPVAVPPPIAWVPPPMPPLIAWPYPPPDRQLAEPPIIVYNSSWR